MWTFISFRNATTIKPCSSVISLLPTFAGISLRVYSPKTKAGGTRNLGTAVSLMDLTAREIATSKSALGLSIIIFRTVVLICSWYRSHIDNIFCSSIYVLSTLKLSVAAIRMNEFPKLEPLSTIILFVGRPVEFEVQHKIKPFHTVLVSIFFNLTAVLKCVPSSMTCRIVYLIIFMIMINTSIKLGSLNRGDSYLKKTLNLRVTASTQWQGLQRALISLSSFKLLVLAS